MAMVITDIKLASADEYTLVGGEMMVDDGEGYSKPMTAGQVAQALVDADPNFADDVHTELYNLLWEENGVLYKQQQEEE